jgi:hypothetical protein
MYLDPARLGRAASQYQVPRGATKAAPKRGCGHKPVTATNLLASLDRVHQKIRGSSSATQLADLPDDYGVLTALLVGTYAGVAAPFVPGGSVLSRSHRRRECTPRFRRGLGSPPAWPAPGPVR